MLLTQVMNDSCICQCWQVIKNIQDYIKTMEHGLLVFRYEPFILALECRTPASAQILVTCALSAGFRESGFFFIYFLSFSCYNHKSLEMSSECKSPILNSFGDRTLHADCCINSSVYDFVLEVIIMSSQYILASRYYGNGEAQYCRSTLFNTNGSSNCSIWAPVGF